MPRVWRGEVQHDIGEEYGEGSEEMQDGKLNVWQKKEVNV